MTTSNRILRSKDVNVIYINFTNKVIRWVNGERHWERYHIENYKDQNVFF